MFDVCFLGCSVLFCSIFRSGPRLLLLILTLSGRVHQEEENGLFPENPVQPTVRAKKEENRKLSRQKDE